jgi:hypothetical protein
MASIDQGDLAIEQLRENHGPLQFWIVLPFFIIMTLLSGCRFLVRIKERTLGVEDMFLFLGVVCFTPCTIRFSYSSSAVV